MVDYPLVKIVDRVPTSGADTPTTLLDLNNATPWTTLHDDFTLGSPQFDAEPESRGVDYGYRTIVLRPRMSGTSAAAATALQNLARLLLRETSTVLLLQVAATNDPVYFPLYPSQPGDLDWVDVAQSNWQLRCDLTADPFGQGPAETIGPVTVNNNPAHATNPCWYKIASTVVKGDAPAPVRVEVDPSSSWDDHSPFMSMAALDKSQNPTTPVLWQTNGFAAGTDTVHGTGDALFSGSNKSTVSFATNTTLVTRLSGVAPSAPVPGTYKVFCRMSRSDSGTLWAARFGQVVSASVTRWGPTLTVARTASAAYATWLDLGEHTFPFGATGLEVADAGLGAAPDVDFQVQRTGGTGSAVVDCFLLVPVDTAVTEEVRALLTEFDGAGVTATRLGVWDGTKTPLDFRALDAGTAFATVPMPRVSGKSLRVRPDSTNIFHLLQQTRVTNATLSNSDAIADSASVTFRYNPQYLNLRPDAD